MKRKLHLTLFVIVALLLSACIGPATPPPTLLPPTGGILTVAFLDIGQGDSILVRSPGGMTLLIDGGNSASDGTGVIIPQLREWGADKLDMMAATHPDADHIGGLPAVLENFPVETVALTGQVHTTQVYERFLADIRDGNVNAIETRTGTPIPFDPAVQLQVLGPDDEFVQAQGDNNNASIVIKLTYGNVSFLFTGDAEGEEEQAILAGGADLRSVVLKVGHHGSRSSTSEAFLAAVAPQIGVISAGEGNRYGHPHPEILDRLNQHGVELYRTDERGTITITTDGATLNVTTDR
ncbi:MAG TPA: ComEC/Rec2 family competence protein [Anaerolineae bacterium]|nr:ComEC/Rec2 family competence protein [Anaerolineae bacterium]